MKTPQFDVYKVADVSTRHITRRDAELMGRQDAPGHVACIDAEHGEAGSPGDMFAVMLDRACHSGLLADLKEFGFSSAFVRIFRALYRQRVAYVRRSCKGSKNKSFMKAKYNTNKTDNQTGQAVETKAAAANAPGINSLALLKFEPPEEKTKARPASAFPRPRNPSSAGEPVTLVKARIDVGLGNTLFIRGQGNGLTWEKGQPLNCVDASTWLWSTSQARDQVEFKLLLNDQVWAGGPNLVVQAGRQVEITPAFAGATAG